MKSLILILLLLLGTSNLSAKKIKPDPKAFDLDKISFCVGGIISAKGTINTGTKQGYKNQPAFGMGDVGGSVSVLFGKIGLVFNVLYTSAAMAYYPYDDEASVYRHSYHHLVFNPNIYLGGLILGVNFGKPLSCTFITPDGTETESEGLESLRELILGAKIPVYSNKHSGLNVDIRAGYAWENIGAQLFPASLSLGVSYYYKYRLPKSGK